MSKEYEEYRSSIRNALKAGVAATIFNAGFEKSSPLCLSTLTEMIQSYIMEVGMSARNICEYASRTDPIISDISLALIQMGMDITKLEELSKRQTKPLTFEQQSSTTKTQLRTLRIGQRPDMPSYVPSYLPNFPDPHTYMSRQPEQTTSGTYAELREKAAIQKRDVEKALTTLIAKTGDKDLIFEDDPLAFPLVANVPQPLPYIDALLPKEVDDLPNDFQNELNSDNPYTRPIKMPQLKKKGKTFVPIR